MKDNVIFILAVLRFIPLGVLGIYSVKSKDVPGMIIAALWAGALVAGTFLHSRDASQIIASPLVVLVVWRIVKSQTK